jgi:hypothetical protein
VRLPALDRTRAHSAAAGSRTDRRGPQGRFPSCSSAGARPCPTARARKRTSRFGRRIVAVRPVIGLTRKEQGKCLAPLLVQGLSLIVLDGCRPPPDGPTRQARSRFGPRGGRRPRAGFTLTRATAAASPARDRPRPGGSVSCAGRVLRRELLGTRRRLGSRLVAIPQAHDCCATQAAVAACPPVRRGIRPRSASAVRGHASVSPSPEGGRRKRSPWPRRSVRPRRPSQRSATSRLHSAARLAWRLRAMPSLYEPSAPTVVCDFAFAIASSPSGTASRSERTSQRALGVLPRHSGVRQPGCWRGHGWVTIRVQQSQARYPLPRAARRSRPVSRDVSASHAEHLLTRAAPARF